MMYTGARSLHGKLRIFRELIMIEYKCKWRGVNERRLRDTAAVLNFFKLGQLIHSSPKPLLKLQARDIDRADFLFLFLHTYTLDTNASVKNKVSSLFLEIVSVILTTTAVSSDRRKPPTRNNVLQD